MLCTFVHKSRRVRIYDTHESRIHLQPSRQHSPFVLVANNKHPRRTNLIQRRDRNICRSRLPENLDSVRSKLEKLDSPRDSHRSHETGSCPSAAGIRYLAVEDSRRGSVRPHLRGGSSCSESRPRTFPRGRTSSSNAGPVVYNQDQPVCPFSRLLPRLGNLFFFFPGIPLLSVAAYLSLQTRQ